MKIKLLVAFLVTILVLSIQGCTSKTTQTVTNIDLTNTTVSTSSVSKTVNNPPQVIVPGTTYGIMVNNSEVNYTIPPLSSLKIGSITSPVLPGDTVIVVIETMPKIECTLGIPSADLDGQSLLPTVEGGKSSQFNIYSDNNGHATFTFKVAINSLPGYCRVTITATDTTNETVKMGDVYLPSKQSTVATSFLVY